MEEAKTDASNVNLRGGRLCLDFANTVDPRIGEADVDYLRSYQDLVIWSQHTAILTEADAQQLLHEATRHPWEAAATLARAIALREAIYHIFLASIQEGVPETTDLDILNDALTRAMSQTRIVGAAGGFAWDWVENKTALDRMLWPIVRSAADLLTAPDDLYRVRECAGDACGWLFLDTSKNHSRHWCSMESCGNRAKARRHYQRSRSAEKSDK